MSDEKHIRELAYYIWISEGKPEGQEKRHWEIANQMAKDSHLTGKAPQKRSIDPSEAKGSTEPAQPDQT